jgi:hypothetical protein
MKAETWWMPIDLGGSLWIRWAWRNRSGVVNELNNQYVSWREAGIRVVKAKITMTPIRRKVKKARTR